MSLVPLIYANTAIKQIDLSEISESRMDELETDAKQVLKRRTRRSVRGFVREDTLQSRIDKMRIRVSIVKRSNPLVHLSSRYQLAPKDETSRLAKISKIYAYHLANIISFEKQSQKSVILGQSLELIGELQDAGYYVFTHGQDLAWGAFSDIITELWRSRQPNQIDPFHRKWRLDADVIKWRNIDEYWNSDLWEKSDHANRRSLLSVDGILSRLEPAESAFNVYWFARSILSFPLLRGSLAFFGSTNPQFNDLLFEFYQWVSKNRTSRLNVIAIPKYLLENRETCFAYRSHPYGRPCCCHSLDHENFIKVLDRHQQNIVTYCSSQYRLLTYPLDLHEEVRTFTFDNLSKENQDLFEQKKRTIVEQALAIKLMQEVSS